MCPIEYEPATWKIHRFALPWLPSTAILGFVFVICWLQTARVYIAPAIIVGAVALIFVFFSLPLSYVRRHSLATTDNGVREVELVYRDSKRAWVTVQSFVRDGRNGRA